MRVIQELRHSMIFGANGLIGGRIGRSLAAKGTKWVGTYNERPASGLCHVDIRQAEEVQEIMSRVRPAVVFHCANLAGGVDFCEKQPEAARSFHYNSTTTIGGWCRELESKLVYISSDYVFSDSPEPISETQAPKPLNEYGRLKLQSEEWIRENLKDYLIVRTTNVYGWDPNSQTPNYAMNVFRTVTSGKMLTAPTYLWGTPTYVDDLAEAILRLVDLGETGLYHVVGPDVVNRFEWALRICETFGLNRSLVRPVDVQPAGFIARPLKARLSTDKLDRLSLVRMLSLTAGLRKMKEEKDAVSYA